MRHKKSTTLQPSLAPPHAEEKNYVLGDAFARTVEAAVDGELSELRRAAADFMSAYQAKDKTSLGRRVSTALRKRTVSVDQLRSVERLPVDNKSRSPLVEEQPWPNSPLILSDDQDQVLRRFVLESRRAEELSDVNLALRSNLLLSGPPGTGKSFIAGHVAAQLGLPLYVVRLDALVSSLLGDTAKNIRAVFEFANHGSRFIFLDEMDAVAKKRDDQRELGEIKRVVNTLIQGLDSVSPKTVVVAATNHAHLLDPAIYRRFPYSLDVLLPDAEMRRALWGVYLATDDLAEQEAYAAISAGLTGSDIRDLATAARRSSVISEGPIDMPGLAWAVLNSAIGKLKLPPLDSLSLEAKRKLNAELAAFGSLTFKEIGILTGVSKQAAMRMAKANLHKDHSGGVDG